MMGNGISRYVVYPVRFALYIAHTLVLTTALTMGLVVLSSLSITIAAVFDAVEFFILYLVPILGMATYLAQCEIATWGEEVEDLEYEDAFERAAIQGFVVLYYNLVFLLSILLGVIVGTVLMSSSLAVGPLEVYLIVGFVYPILDIMMFKRWNYSPAAIPVAGFVGVLHTLGRATWVNAKNLNVEHVPFIELFLRKELPR